MKQSCSLKPLRVVSLLLIVLIVIGCSTLEQPTKVPGNTHSMDTGTYNIKLYQEPTHVFNPISIQHIVSGKQLEPRVEQLIFLVDQSSALSGKYRGIQSRLYARDIVHRFVQTMPDQTYSGAFLISGLRPNHSNDKELRIINYTRQDIEYALDTPAMMNRIKATSLAAAIDQITQLIAQNKRRTAVILVSSWSQIDKEVERAIMRMRQHTTFAENKRGDSESRGRLLPKQLSSVCFYTLGVGNRVFRTPLTAVNYCGYKVAAYKVAQPRDMAHFVQHVLYKGPMDSDGDGIYNYQDRCPETPAGRVVDYSGCLRFALNKRGSLE